MQIYKVFFNTNLFLFTYTRDKDKNNYEYPAFTTDEEFRETVFRFLESGKNFKVAFVSGNPEEIFIRFKSLFHEVKAAGGVVTNADGILMIKRNGIYDLPKGHMEKGESPEECALRETEEECGICNLRITGPPSLSYHIYSREGVWILKETCWYPMHAPEKQSLSPQYAESITEAFFMSPGESFPINPDTTYPSVIDILKYHRVL